MAAEADQEVPVEFICPLSHQIMRDPVIIASGETYERAFIKEWLSFGQNVCPKTLQPLSHAEVLPNVALKTLIENWCSKYRKSSKTISPSASTAHLSVYLSKIKIGDPTRGLAPRLTIDGLESPRISPKSSREDLDSPRMTSPMSARNGRAGFDESSEESSASGGKEPKLPFRKSTLGNSGRFKQGAAGSVLRSPKSPSGIPPRARQGGKPPVGGGVVSPKTPGKEARERGGAGGVRGSSGDVGKFHSGGSDRERGRKGEISSGEDTQFWHRSRSWDERSGEEESSGGGGEGRPLSIKEGREVLTKGRPRSSQEFHRQTTSPSLTEPARMARSASTGNSAARGGNESSGGAARVPMIRFAPLKDEETVQSKQYAFSKSRSVGTGGQASYDDREGKNEVVENSDRQDTMGMAVASKKKAASRRAPNDSGKGSRGAAKNGNRRTGGKKSGQAHEGRIKRQGSGDERRHRGLATSESVADLLDAMDKGNKSERTESSLRLKDIMRDSPTSLMRFLDYKDSAAILVDMMDEAAEDIIRELESKGSMKERGLGAAEGCCDVLESVVSVVFQLCEDYDGASDMFEVGGIPAIVDVVDLPVLGSEDGSSDQQEAVLWTQIEFVKGTAAAALFALASWDDEEEDDSYKRDMRKSYRREIQDTGGIPPLLALLKAESARSRKDAALALFSLSHDAQCAEEIVLEKGVEALVDVLGDKRVGVEEKAMAALGNLVREKGGKDALLAVDGILCILDVLESDSERAREEALFALHHLLVTEKVDPALLLNDGALFPVAKMAQRKESPPEAMELYELLLAARKGAAAP